MPHLRTSTTETGRFDPATPSAAPPGELLARLRVRSAGPEIAGPSFGFPPAELPERTHLPVAPWPEPEAGATVSFLGIAFDRLPETLLIGRLAAATQAGVFSYLVTPNVDHVLRIRRDPEIAALYRRAFLCVNDSRVLARLAALAGLSLPAIPGADIVVRLLQDPRLPRDTPVLIVGGDEGLGAQVAALSGLTQVAQVRPPMGLMRDPEAFAATVRAVEAVDARLVFLAVGSPQQEFLAAALARNGRARGLALCIGAGLEFMVGARRRAPAWMQAAGLEWLFRLGSEPRRLGRRYLVDGPQIARVYIAYLRERAAARAGG